MIDVHIPMQQGEPLRFAYVRFLHTDEIRMVLRWQDELVVEDRMVVVAVANLRNGS